MLGVDMLSYHFLLAQNDTLLPIPKQYVKNYGTKRKHLKI